MKIPILIENEENDDDTFCEDFLRITGLYTHEFKHHADKMHHEYDDWLGWKLGIFCLESYCDAQYDHLLIEINDDSPLLVVQTGVPQKSLALDRGDDYDSQYADDIAKVSSYPDGKKRFLKGCFADDARNVYLAIVVASKEGNSFHVPSKEEG